MQKSEFVFNLPLALDTKCGGVYINRSTSVDIKYLKKYSRYSLALFDGKYLYVPTCGLCFCLIPPVSVFSTSK